MAVRHVLLLSNERETINAVTDALQSNGKLQPDDVCADVMALAARLELGRIPAALVDIDADPQRTLAALEPLARRFSDTRFVVLSTAMHNELLLKAMKAGARHFVLKEAIGWELHEILQHCRAAGHGSNGHVVTVLSAGGGCGATTVAVNLAAELHLLEKESKQPKDKKAAAAAAAAAAAHPAEEEPALVVDLDPYYGAVAAYLGVEGEYGLFDILSRSGSLDAQLIQSTAQAKSESLHVLMSVPRSRLGQPVTIDTQRLGVAVDACRAGYRWTVIDAARVPAPAAAELVRHSAVTLLLMQLNVKDIRAARRILATLAEEHVPASAVRVIATRYRRRGVLIDPEEARRALALMDNQPLGLLPNDFYAVAEAGNLGKVLAEAAPKSEFRRELQKLAATIAAATPVVSAAAAGPAPGYAAVR